MHVIGHHDVGEVVTQPLSGAAFYLINYDSCGGEFLKYLAMFLATGCDKVYPTRFRISSCSEFVVLVVRHPGEVAGTVG